MYYIMYVMKNVIVMIKNDSLALYCFLKDYKIYSELEAQL